MIKRPTPKNAAGNGWMSNLFHPDTGKVVKQAERKESASYNAAGVQDPGDVELLSIGDDNANESGPPKDVRYVPQHGGASDWHKFKAYDNLLCTLWRRRLKVRLGEERSDERKQRAANAVLYDKANSLYSSLRSSQYTSGSLAVLMTTFFANFLVLILCIIMKTQVHVDTSEGADPSEFLKPMDLTPSSQEMPLLNYNLPTR